jgi:hypothetical protein
VLPLLVALLLPALLELGPLLELPERDMLLLAVASCMLASMRAAALLASRSS